MNEEEWLICAKPDLMLRHLQTQFRFRSLTRKLRLFICTCRRVGWELTSTSDERFAIEVAECFADGHVTHAVRDAARWKIRLRRFRSVTRHQTLAIYACEADSALVDNSQRAAASLVQAWTEAALGPNAHQRPGSEWKEWQAKHRRAVCYYLRDIFGNPFRTFAVDSLWVEWNNRIVPKLAQAIYEEYAFDRLPILADALEEAGCTDAEILNHCRQPGEHVRGCWGVDLILGKS